MWQHCRDNQNDNIIQSKSFKYKIKMTRKAAATGNAKDVKKPVPLKYISNIWRTLEIPLINCEISLDFSCSKKCVIFSEFKTTDTKLCSYCNFVNWRECKTVKKLECQFKRTINWNKYHTEFKTFPQNGYFNYLIDPNFQAVNTLLVLPFENETDREVQTKYYLSTEEIKDYNVIIDAKNFFNQPIKNDFKTQGNIRKIATGQGDDYKIGYLLDYNYLKEYYKLIVTNLSKQ